MPKHSILLVLIFCLILCLPGHAASAFTFTANYAVITGFGPVASFPRELPPGEKLVLSSDKINAYRVKTLPVQNEAHLLQLMGATEENSLTDLQKGLLESYRFAMSQSFDSLKQRVPGASPSVTLNLVDVNGYNDTIRYPKIVDDFWPQNSRIYRYSGNNLEMSSEIRISGTDCFGYGSETAATMKKTFAHEFGHSMDMTSIENGAYDYDGAHYINEKIEPKASFAEGFANFIRMIFFPEDEPQFRDSIKTIKIEKPEGGYDEYPLVDSKLAGEGFLDVEAINTLIFTRLAVELPDGQKMVLDSFQKHNASENRMSMFLKNFIADYPFAGEKVATILDRETSGKLSENEIRQILGKNSGVEKFLLERPAMQASKKEPEKKIEEPSRKSITIYKWKNADGVIQFTSQPPADGVEYSVINRAAEPGRASPITIENPETDPFIVGY